MLGKVIYRELFGEKIPWNAQVPEYHIKRNIPNASNSLPRSIALNEE